MSTSFEDFHALWQRLGARGDAAAIHEQLITAYSETARAYHTVQHLDECLHLLHQTRETGAMKSPDTVEMALWMHDAVYDPTAGDNEEQSAALARHLLISAGVSGPLVAEIERLVLLTKTHLALPNDDGAWIIDIDLAILGQPAPRFQEYEAQIAQEYAWAPAPVYREKRAEVLQRFLDRPTLFLTPLFRDRFENAARANLFQALHLLSPSAS